MRILIDECLPRKLKYELSDHDVSTVKEMGWSGVKNGMLLRRMTGQFEVFVTIDGNMQYQQNLSQAQFIVVVLKAHNNSLSTLKPLMPDVRARLSELKPGDVVRFGGPTSST